MWQNTVISILLILQVLFQYLQIMNEYQIWDHDCTHHYTLLLSTLFATFHYPYVSMIQITNEDV